MVFLVHLEDLALREIKDEMDFQELQVCRDVMVTRLIFYKLFIM